MDVAEFACGDCRPAIERFAKDIEESSETIGRNWHVQRPAGIDQAHAALQAPASMQRDRPQVSFVEMLVDFEKVTLMVERGAERLSKGWKVLPLADDGGTVNLGDDARPLLDVLLCRPAHISHRSAAPFRSATRRKGGSQEWPFLRRLNRSTCAEISSQVSSAFAFALSAA